MAGHSCDSGLAGHINHMLPNQVSHARLWGPKRKNVAQGEGWPLLALLLMPDFCLDSGFGTKTRQGLSVVNHQGQYVSPACPGLRTAWIDSSPPYQYLGSIGREKAEGTWPGFPGENLMPCGLVLGQLPTEIANEWQTVRVTVCVGATEKRGKRTPVLLCGDFWWWWWWGVG